MKPVSELPRNGDLSLEDLMLFAFWVIEPHLFILPLKVVENMPSLTKVEGQYVISLIESHQATLDSFNAPELKIA